MREAEMSTTTEVDEREARRVAEQARDSEWRQPSFAKELYLGRFRPELVEPHPRPDAETVRRGEAFLTRLREFLHTVDGPAIERDAKIPPEVLTGLAEVGAFGMKIPEEYGGVGLGQVYYNRALMLVGTVNPSLGALLSAHQSIGVPEPVKQFGTEEQNREFLPRSPPGAVSASPPPGPDAGGRLPPRRDQAVGHQRDDRRAARRPRPGPGRRGAPRRDHRLRRRGRLPRHHRRAAQRVHGAARAGEQPHPVHVGAGPGRPPARGGGPRPEDRARDAHHGPAVHPGTLRRGEQVVAEDRAGVGPGAGPVGPAGGPARRRR